MTHLSLDVPRGWCSLRLGRRCRFRIGAHYACVKLRRVVRWMWTDRLWRQPQSRFPYSLRLKQPANAAEFGGPLQTGCEMYRRIRSEVHAMEVASGTLTVYTAPQRRRLRRATRRTAGALAKQGGCAVVAWHKRTPQDARLR